MDIDFDAVSEKELLTLHARVDKALGSLAARRKLEARKAAQAVAEKHGFNLADLVDAAPGKAGKGVNPPKYRNPADQTQTWSGKGRQPAWYKQGIAAGRKADDLLI